MKRIRIAAVLLACVLGAATAAAQPVSGPWSRVILAAGPIITGGAGSPEGVITAPTGSLYLQSDGAAGLTLWTKQGAGATGWTTTGGGGGGTSPHPILSSSHSDATTATVIRGALIVGGSIPTWSRLLLGPAGSFLQSNGTDLTYGTDGSTLTALNASQLTTGTVPDARLSPAVSLFGATVDTAEITPGAITFPTWGSNGCTPGQIPKYTGSVWSCAPDDAGTGSAHGILSTTHSDTVPGTLTAGDLLFANGTAALTRLPVGTAGQVLTVTAGAPAWAAPAATGHTIADEGSALTARPSLNFTGAGVTCTDNAGATRTDCTIPGGAAYCQTGENSAGSSGTAATLNWNTGNQQLVTLTGNATITLANPVSGCAYRVFFTQDATGGRTVTWPASVKWGSLATAPTVIATAAAQTVCALFYSGAASGYQGFCDVGGTTGGGGGGSGAVVQVKNFQTGALATGTTIIPFDDTIPQSTEGDQYLSLAITPTSATDVLRIDVLLYSTTSTGAWNIVALFQDSGTDAIAVQGLFASAATAGGGVALTYYMVAGTTSTTTFKVRAGPHVAGTMTVNGQTGARKFGGALASSITITEIKP